VPKDIKSVDGTMNSRQDADPVSAFKKGHQDLLALCDQLEEIADSLPDQINRQKCLYAARALCPLIRTIDKFEEEVLFPQIKSRMPDNTVTPKTLTRLRFDHCEDECFAEELSEALHKLGKSSANINMETTGYMLRGFFEALRRHIAFENEVVLRWKP